MPRLFLQQHKKRNLYVSMHDLNQTIVRQNNPGATWIIVTVEDICWNFKKASSGIRCSITVVFMMDLLAYYQIVFGSRLSSQTISKSGNSIGIASCSSFETIQIHIYSSMSSR